jgi:glyoxylase-like metal-dependent hydrolase (beta-lactamase superfamily II)
MACFIAGLISTNSFGQQIYTNDNVVITNLDNNLFLLKETTWFTANILGITGEDGILLMDTGLKDVSDDLADAIQFLGKDVSIIINSHHHPDHIGGNEAFGTGLKIIGHKECKDKLPSEGFEIIAIDEEYTFDFSSHEVICIPFPGGHSQCDMIVYIPDLKITYLGDLYLSESFPLVIIEVGSKAQTVVDNLKEILDIVSEDTRLFAGHGKETTTADLEEYIKMLETTIDIVRAEMNSGNSLEEIMDADLLKDFGQWGKFFDFITKETWIEQIYLSYEL